MFGYLVARRDWRACGYFIGASILGCAVVLVLAEFAPAASFARLAAGALLTHSSGVPIGLLKHPANLNLGAFVRLVAGGRGWASAAALAVELAAAAAAFAAAGALADDRHGYGFALWLPHLHFSYFLPAEAAFVSLVCAYFAACLAARFESSGAAAPKRPETEGREAVRLRAISN